MGVEADLLPYKWGPTMSNEPTRSIGCFTSRFGSIRMGFEH